MKTIKVKLYQYSELNDTAKEKARNWFLNGNSFEFEWECLKDDAKTVGINLTAWEYRRYCSIELRMDFSQVLSAILANYGESCATYKTAEKYQKEYAKLTEEQILNGDDEELRESFIKDIAEDYRVLADDNFEYTQSEEYISEAMESNEYTFLEDGTRFD